MVADTAEKPSLSLIDKFGLKFYSATIVQALIVLIVFKFHAPVLALSMIGFTNVIGAFLPIKAKDDREHSRVQNNNKWLLGPLIVSCLSTPVILAYSWLNYDYILNAPIG